MLMQQHKNHMAQMEKHRDSVREEIEKVAEMLIHARTERNEGRTGRRRPTRRRAAALAALRQAMLKKGHTDQTVSAAEHIEEAVPTVRTLAWYQRLTDNYRLRELQHKAMRLRTTS
jgi:uncharacterized coiled-coil DUF342 family protein